METRMDLKKDVREQAAAVLAPAVAAAADLSLAGKEAHWNVKGPNFIALHELFDKLVDDARDYTDSLAERMVQLGVAPQGTLQAVAQASPLKPYPLGKAKEKEHLEALAERVAALAALTRAGIDKTSQAGDQATADLFTEITRGLDKHLWMLEAHLAG